MLSYQHGYHAGNFADVVKHLTLTRLLSYLIQKDKPLFYLETHSGRGLYDLKDKQALKTEESKDGIQLLWQIRKNLPAPFYPYLDYLQQLNPGEGLRYYPGSPWISLHSLRTQDRLFCCELHPAEFEALQGMSKEGKRIIFEESDGFTKLNALLPPPERRGLIFIDPSYEIKSEYKQVPLYLKQAYERFSTGVYCIWYPIVDKKFHEQLVRGFKNIEAAKHLQIEFNLSPTTGSGMTGCGLWIINPPYVLINELKEALKVLSTIFNPGKSFFIVEE
jgi:23S rRNA (adenine2030-N6)-methyltransferase